MQTQKKNPIEMKRFSSLRTTHAIIAAKHSVYQIMVHCFKCMSTFSTEKFTIFSSFNVFMRMNVANSRSERMPENTSRALTQNSKKKNDFSLFIFFCSTWNGKLIDDESFGCHFLLYFSLSLENIIHSLNTVAPSPKPEIATETILWNLVKLFGNVHESGLRQRCSKLAQAMAMWQTDLRDQLKSRRRALDQAVNGKINQLAAVIYLMK